MESWAVIARIESLETTLTKRDATLR